MPSRDLPPKAFARRTGATLLAGGKRDGAMHEATLLDNVPRECDVVKEEVFGPVVVMDRYATFKDAIAMCVACGMDLKVHV